MGALDEEQEPGALAGTQKSRIGAALCNTIKYDMFFIFVKKKNVTLETL